MNKNKVSDSVTQCVCVCLCWWCSGFSAAKRVISRRPDIRWITGGSKGTESLLSLFLPSLSHLFFRGRNKRLWNLLHLGRYKSNKLTKLGDIRNILVTLLLISGFTSMEKLISSTCLSVLSVLTDKCHNTHHSLSREELCSWP